MVQREREWGRTARHINWQKTENTNNVAKNKSKAPNLPCSFRAGETDKMATAMPERNTKSVRLAATAGGSLKLPLIPSQAICTDN